VVDSFDNLPFAVTTAFPSHAFVRIQSKTCTAMNFKGIITRNIHVARTIDEVRKYRSNLGLKKLGFVPTMGALHKGHISLVERAKKECDFVATSIFVNPTQFSAGEDLDKYPRTFDKDLELFKAAGVDFVFAPLLEDMYPDNTLCHVEPSQFSLIDEGKARPDFFRGVATIVCKLFNIVQPNISYFGQKDISQCILVNRMVVDLNLPVEIKVCETIREKDGLAMSSRNTYLTEDERKVANVLYKALNSGKIFCSDHQKENVSREEIIAIIHDVLKSESLVSRVEYISVGSHLNMKELDRVSKKEGAVLSCAMRIGSVRLIDNVLVGEAEKYILKL
jgi:pantoate--beta-alanine ligase